MWRSVLIVLVGGIAAVSHADGIPVDRDTGKITVPYTEVALDADQIEELDCLGTVTLTKSQWANLRKVAPHVPKRIETVVPLDYDDCTCDIGYYCIATTPGRVAVLHGDAVPFDAALAFEYEDEVLIRVDAGGHFFYKGHMLEYAKLTEALGKPPADTSETKSDGRFLFFATPKHTAAAVKTRIDELWKTARKAGWRSYYDAGNRETETGVDNVAAKE